MKPKQINPGIGDALEQHNWGIVKLALEDMLPMSWYDADRDTLIDLTAGGTAADLSGILKGSILVCNADAIITTAQSSERYDVPTIQPDGTIAWQGGVKTLMLNDEGAVVTNDDGDIVTVES